jgi:aldehyde:ferredoxin oxidoreductase
VLDREKFEKMKDEYYEQRGWDLGTGVPTPEKLAELGLENSRDRVTGFS